MRDKNKDYPLLYYFFDFKEFFKLNHQALKCDTG